MLSLKKYTPPILSDIAGVGLALMLLPYLRQQFLRISSIDFLLTGFTNSAYIGFFFLLFCLSVFGLRKLQPLTKNPRPVPPLLLDKRLRGALGVFFALSISTATAYVTGFLDSVVAINRGLLDEPSITIYLLLTPASWFGLALIYVLVLTNETEASVDPAANRYGVVSFLSLAGVNLMGVVLAAVWQALWQRFSGVQATELFILFNFVLYLALIGPPRLIYFTRNRHPVTFLTFIPFVLYLAVLSAP